MCLECFPKQNEDMEAYGGECVIAPLIHDLGTKWGWWSVPHLNSSWVSPSAVLDGLKKRKISCHGQELNHNSSSFQLVA